MKELAFKKLNRSALSLEQLVVENDVIFINADALTSTLFPEFVSNIIPLLVKHNKQLVVSKTAISELKQSFLRAKSSISPDDIDTEAHTYMVLSALDKLINRKLLCYYADEITGSVAKPVQSIIKEISAEMG